jgi:bacteriocin-like protein
MKKGKPNMENFFAEVGQELTDEQLSQVTGGTGIGDSLSSFTALVPSQYQSLVAGKLSLANGAPSSSTGLGGLLGTGSGSSSSALTGLFASFPSGSTLGIVGQGSPTIPGLG